MPNISTHLHLALKLSRKIEIKDLNAFYLGNAYPDQWKNSVEKSLDFHYKNTLSDICDCESFMKNEEMNDFNFGYYFHLWVDNHILEINTSDLTKYDCLICDMQVIYPIIMELKQESFTGKEYQAMQNILELEYMPLPLYMVTPDKRKRYEELLDQIVDEFLEKHLYNENGWERNDGVIE